MKFAEAIHEIRERTRSYAITQTKQRAARKTSGQDAMPELSHEIECRRHIITAHLNFYHELLGHPAEFHHAPPHTKWGGVPEEYYAALRRLREEFGKSKIEVNTGE